MKVELHYYDIFPKVFLVKEPVTITVKPLGAHVMFSGDYTVSVSSMAHGMIEFYPERNNQIDYTVHTDEDGCLKITHSFPEEGEYIIRISKAGQRIANLYVYALEEDMRGRYPFRGNLHTHTCRSDGKQSPDIVAANYRKHGYDFLSINDHRRYYPSLEAIEAYRDVPCGLTLVYGEEIHLPDNDVHIVNFGSTYSVNGLIDVSKQNEESSRRAVIDNPPPVMTVEQYREEVTALAATLNIPEHIESFVYASCVWAWQHIRNGGGLAIHAHPYWEPYYANPYNVPESLNDYILETHPFDAFEVLNGESHQRTLRLQPIKYYECREKGIHFPIVGSTDDHTSLLEQKSTAMSLSTFVFARENEREALIAAIKDEYSVAVDNASGEYRMVGDFRLVKYTRFLMDEFVPLHDDLCYEEGRLMKTYVTGDKSAVVGLGMCSERMTMLYEKYFRLN